MNEINDLLSDQNESQNDIEITNVYVKDITIATKVLQKGLKKRKVNFGNKLI